MLRKYSARIAYFCSFFVVAAAASFTSANCRSVAVATENSRPAEGIEPRSRSAWPSATTKVQMKGVARLGTLRVAISGLRNRDLQALLFDEPAADDRERRRRSGRGTRKLRLLRAHGRLRKVPHTHRDLVS